MSLVLISFLGQELFLTFGQYLSYDKRTARLIISNLFNLQFPRLTVYLLANIVISPRFSATLIIRVFFF